VIERRVFPRMRYMILSLSAIAVGVFLLALLWVGTASARTTGSPSAATAAVPPAGNIAYEIVGRIDQDGASFASYGYVTYASGLSGDVLFSDPLLHSEATARITFYTTATLTARSVISGVFVLNSTALADFYFRSVPGATFSDPTSFKTGTLIATTSGRYQDVLNVQGPNLGIASTSADLTQQSAVPFTYYGSTYTFGQPGLAEHLWFTGEGTRTDAVIPRSFVVGAGNVTLTGYGVHLPIVSKNDGS
jgi:hypothetical protein